MSGYTLADVARIHEIAESNVRSALRRPNPTGEKAIAAVMGKKLYELWPERWTRDGKRIRPRYAHLYKETAA